MTARPASLSSASPALAALRIAYSDLSTIALSIDEQDAWLPTRCPGWAVRDLFVHLLGDVQRALVALATPAVGPPDRDRVTHWRDVPSMHEQDFTELRAQRTIASAWGLEPLTRTFAETTRAVLMLAARTPPETPVATGDHVISADDLLVTLAVEAAVHHLDMVVHMRRPGPRPEPLAFVRETLDALLGAPVPEDWSDERWALLGTGRVPPGGRERRELGSAMLQLPLLC